MFTLAIHYLNGWAMAAADGARKEQIEWPPHPDRVFMALAAAWFETGEDPAEGAALRWLETLDPPAIAATNAEPRHAVGSQRPTVSYVPVNDVSVGRKIPDSTNTDLLMAAGLAVLPERRPRQPRCFPVAIPSEPFVYLIWQQAELREHRAALERLVRKVTHVGHPASFVQIWIEETERDAIWAPMAGITEHRLRVPNAGRLEYLRQCCNRDAVLAYADLQAQAAMLKGKEKKQMNEAIEKRFGPRPPVSLHPAPGRWQGYSRRSSVTEQAVPGSVFDPRLLALAVSGQHLPLPTTLKLIEALRNALMTICPDQPPPEWFSGHTPAGRPSSEPHLALIPLPFVGAEHADGHIMGLGLALPAKLDPQEAARCFGPILHDIGTGLPRQIKLFNGKWFECKVEIDTRESAPVNLRAATWTRSSCTWASVTPVVLDRHFDGEDKWERAAESVKDACTYIGLPRPREVILHPVSLVEGAPHAREFPCLVRKSDGGRRFHSHVVLVFEEKVCGPVLIGAGRYRGYGLCRPLDERGDRHD